MQKLDTILLIDDDHISNYLNQNLISSLQITYSIPIASNGKEGLEFLKKNLIKNNYNLSNLILLDIQMPEMDGYEFLLQFNKLSFQPEQKVNLVILTSENKLEERKLKGLGNFEHLQKPLSEEKLLMLVNKYFQYNSCENLTM